MNNVRMVSLVRLVMLVCAGAVCGCGEKEPTSRASGEPSVSVATSSNELSAVPGLSSDRFDTALQSEMVRVDPSQDGWSTEVVSGNILKTMKAFDVWVRARRDGPSPLKLASEFRGSLTTADGLPLVYENPPYEIRRGVPKKTVDGTTWLASWPNQMEAHFKVVHITELSDRKVSVSLLMDRASEQVQENAMWKLLWDISGGGAVTLRSAELLSYERVERQASALPLFADATGSAIGKEAAFRDQFANGIDHWRDRLDWRFGIEVSGPHGLAVGDVNGDGLDDLYVCESGGLPNRLFVQQAGGTAVDVSREAGVNFLESTNSALLVDWDNDGDQDLVFAAGRHVFFYANDGEAKFVQKAVAQSDSVARSMAAADYDNDGDLDVYICGYFSHSVDSVGLGRPMPYHDAKNSVRNHLLANLGDWRFRDVTEEVGMDMNNRRFSYAASWEDFDNDGDMDLYVANDFGRNNFYQNNGGVFEDIAARAGVEDISAGMSVSWSDYNQDGLMDVYVGNMFSSAGNRIAYQRQFREGLDAEANRAMKRHARGNSLFQNRGDGTFEDVTLPAGVNMGRWAWSSHFADVNNDSHEDLLVANGMVTSAEDTGDL